ncbi:hypothetical protein MJ581_22235 [Escherichia coli]|nr:hypothetical protein MJ581_22235 [Escherichia coli]
MRDVSPSTRHRHDRFTYGSKLHQLPTCRSSIRLMKVDGREQVIPFRTKSIWQHAACNQDHDTPLLGIFR